MKRYLHVMTAIAIIVAAGTVHGIWTFRWHVAEEPIAAAARMREAVPVLADWQESPIDKEVPRGPWVAGQFYRRYVHRRTGQTVTAFMICGRPGPIAVHTPDVCYGAGGFDVVSRAKFARTVAPDLPPVEFDTALFRKKTTTDPLTLRIYWGWHAGEAWQAPTDPRYTFAREPVLYKIYIIHETTGKEEPTTDDEPCVELMRQLLPELERRVFSKS